MVGREVRAVEPGHPTENLLGRVTPLAHDDVVVAKRLRQHAAHGTLDLARAKREGTVSDDDGAARLWHGFSDLSLFAEYRRRWR
jgi:hypothetical protein